MSCQPSSGKCLLLEGALHQHLRSAMRVMAKINARGREKRTGNETGHCLHKCQQVVRNTAGPQRATNGVGVVVDEQVSWVGLATKNEVRVV
jgi:hypothetical protein